MTQATLSRSLSGWLSHRENFCRNFLPALPFYLLQCGMEQRQWGCTSRPPAGTNMTADERVLPKVLAKWGHGFHSGYTLTVCLVKGTDHPSEKLSPRALTKLKLDRVSEVSSFADGGLRPMKLANFPRPFCKLVRKPGEIIRILDLLSTRLVDSSSSMFIDFMVFYECMHIYAGMRLCWLVGTGPGALGLGELRSSFGLHHCFAL